MDSYNEKERLYPFREGLFEFDSNGNGYLIGNRCHHCDITFFPKRAFCTECYQSDGLKDIKLSKTGTLHTFTVVHRGTPDYETPYIIGYVDLEEDGVRVFAPITNCEPEELEIGMKMELVFGKMNRIAEDEGDNKLLTYKFRPGKPGMTPQ